MNRSQIRHALYRAKNGIFADEKKHIYDMVEPKIPENESWSTFAKNWDIFYKDDELTVIKPEVDYDFIHTTCIEKSLHTKNGLQMNATDRQLNTIQIVELSMLEGKMSWETYNVTWGVSVDHELKRINTRLFTTVVNEVTEEMLKKSAPSDGNAMVKTPELTAIELNEFQEMSDAEIESIKKTVSKTKKKGKRE